MNYKPIKFYYTIDEATSIKIKTLLGKRTFTLKEVQNLIDKLISNTYEKQKGKPYK